MVDLTQLAFLEDVAAAVAGWPSVRWFAARSALESLRLVERLVEVHDLGALLERSGAEAASFPLVSAVEGLCGELERGARLLILRPSQGAGWASGRGKAASIVANTTTAERNALGAVEETGVEVLWIDPPCFPLGSGSRLRELSPTGLGRELSVWLGGRCS